MENIEIKAEDGLILSCIYSKALNPKACVQIVHGMIEHKERYIELINYLNNNGYTVIISDLRGHGKSINDEYSLGHIGDIDLMVSDQLVVTEYIKNKNPKLPLFMYAHSMGSLIGRAYIEKNDLEIKKLILSGTVGRPAGVILANFVAGIKDLFGSRKSSKLLWVMSNGASKDPSHDWLSYNKENVKNFESDPLCSFYFDNHSYKVLFNMTNNLKKKRRYKCQNPELKILSISGKDDRTTLGEKGLRNTIRYLFMAGYHNIKYFEYLNMKHEILFEDNKESVFKDIVAFYGE